MLKLYIGNKNYSSWSMRPWVLLRQAGIAFEEVRVRFDSFDAGSEFKRTMGPVSPTGKVPVLVDGDLVVWDTLAIAEYLAETYPEKHLWPQDKAARAHARSICAEMHSGFTALRSHCPMNIEADLAVMAELEHAFKFNDAVLRHLTVLKKSADTGPSSMMKTVEREEARKVSQAEYAAAGER